MAFTLFRELFVCFTYSIRRNEMLSASHVRVGTPSGLAHIQRASVRLSAVDPWLQLAVWRPLCLQPVRSIRAILDDHVCERIKVSPYLLCESTCSSPLVFKMTSSLLIDCFLPCIYSVYLLQHDVV